MFSRLGAWCARRRGLVVIAWIVVLVALGATSGAVGSNFSTEFGLPAGEPTRGFDLLEQHMGGEVGGEVAHAALDQLRDQRKSRIHPANSACDGADGH